MLIVIGAMLLLFTLSAIVPGDPATTLLGPQATPELSRRFIAEMGLDQPLPIRLWRFFANVADRQPRRRRHLRAPGREADPRGASATR